MSAAPQRPDLSFLSDEEARTIFQVLQRDSELRRAEKDRVRKLLEKKKSEAGLQGVTGEWFEEIQRKKFQNNIDINTMLKPPLEHQLRNSKKSNHKEFKMSSCTNPQAQKNTSSSFLGFRSPFAWLFSFRKSRKTQTQKQPRYDDSVSTAPKLEEMATTETCNAPMSADTSGHSFDVKQDQVMEESTQEWNEQLEKEFFSGRTQFKVVIKALSPKEITRIYTPHPLDRNDGTFLMRYRMYGSVRKGLKIEILYGDKHVAQSPYILKGPVYHEYCDCPEEDPEIWQNVFSCPSQEPQITKDFIPFPTIDLQRMFKEIPSKFSQTRGAIVHYTILNNRIYRRSLGKYTDFKMFSDEMLLSLARKVRLPDVEFYLNVGDWPVEYRKANDTPGPIPIISWCGSVDSRDIILPTYDITHSTLETLRGVTNDLLSIQGNTGPFWDNKTEQALFRGRDSREERLYLVKLSKENPELLDAGITGYFFFREKEKELGKVPLMGFFDFFKYKYQVNVDGTVAAYRFPYLLLGDSLVLKQDSQYYEHFYTVLKPWKHYVPVKRSLEDLLEKIRWAKVLTRTEVIACLFECTKESLLYIITAQNNRKTMKKHKKLLKKDSRWQENYFSLTDFTATTTKCCRNMPNAKPANLKYGMEWNLYLSLMTETQCAAATGRSL
ncbi:protein O-glucosyltransferase 3-like isoform X4 [Centrocercus urophasianus]|uniref:protein O-glucosyltransferase 3-like isoform X4 n=1 Tax=Centrocercus urophasianus TaxID=9002 RepID=UPI001C652E4F|nr:protein O-glucosyltransferase 3-like isoform X4 [Centrocercus urophasianus]